MALNIDGLTVRSPFLGSLPQEALEAVVSLGHGAHRRAGRQLIGPREDAAAVLLSGLANTWARTASGAEYLRRIHDPGETLGLPGVLGSKVDQSEVVAHGDVEFLWLPGSPLRRLTADRPEILRACLRSVLCELDQARDEESLLAETGTTERVALRIVELAERWGREERDGIHIDIALTQEELAAWARCSRESTAKVLHTLREAGVVATGRRELVVLDLLHLRERTRTLRVDPTVRALLKPIG